MMKVDEPAWHKLLVDPDDRGALFKVDDWVWVVGRERQQQVTLVEFKNHGWVYQIMDPEGSYPQNVPQNHIIETAPPYVSTLEQVHDPALYAVDDWLWISWAHNAWQVHTVKWDNGGNAWEYEMYDPVAKNTIYVTGSAVLRTTMY